MELKEMKANFLHGKCEEIKDYIDEAACQELYNKMNKQLRRAGCKCKHKGIRKSYINQFTEALNLEQ